MSEALKFFDGIMVEQLASIYTCLPCRIVTFYGDSADVQPIPKRKLKDGREVPYPMLIKVPVLKRKYKPSVDVIVETPFYEKEDIVLVSFINRDLSNGVIIGVI